MMHDRRGLGYKHRPPRLTERASSALRSFRVGADFEPTEHPPFPLWFRQIGALDQGAFNACTGFGTMLALWLERRKAEEKPHLLSPLLPYAAARLRETGGGPIDDTGAYVDDLVWAFNAFGSCPEQVWPFVDLSHAERAEVVNAKPSQIAFQYALSQRYKFKLRMRRIVDYGDRLLQRTAHSLHLGQPCMIAIPVDARFLAGRSNELQEGFGPPLGYHFLTLLDWRGNAYTGYQFLAGNSWGPEWGDHGTAWLAPSLVKQSQGVWYLDGVER